MKILRWGCWLMASTILSSTGRAQSNLMPQPAQVTPAAKARAELLLMIVAPVQKLVDAAASQ